jgi:hypothetical protein
MKNYNLLQDSSASWGRDGLPPVMIPLTGGAAMIYRIEAQ